MVALLGGPRWRRVAEDDLRDVVRRLQEWPCPAGGHARHMFSLASIEARGASVVRVAQRGSRWAACVVLPRRLVVPAGDPSVIASAGMPLRRWRLVIGDAAASDALLEPYADDPGVIIHEQRFQTVDADRVPSPTAVPDPGLRRAVQADVDGLAQLAVQLHVDDRYGPDPGRGGLQAYRDRMRRSVERGSVACVGDEGDPVVKLEYAVDSSTYGVQLAGICARPEVRGRGLGLGAVATAVRRALVDRPGLPISLHVRADNHAALRAYAGAGFVDREEWRLSVRSA